MRISGGAFYMTNTVAPEVQAGAWEFMKYMQTTDEPGRLAPGRLLPADDPGGRSDPRVTELLGGRPGRQDAEDRLRAAPRGRSGQAGPSIGPYPQYDEAVRKSLESMAFDGASPDDAIAQAQEAIQAALDASTSRTTPPELHPARAVEHRLAETADPVARVVGRLGGWSLAARLTELPASSVLSGVSAAQAQGRRDRPRGDGRGAAAERHVPSRARERPQGARAHLGEDAHALHPHPSRATGSRSS